MSGTRHARHERLQGRVKAIGGWGVLSLLCVSAPAQWTPPQTEVARSHSGQFVVRALPGANSTAPASNLETNKGFIRLTPALVPVSCERVKQLLGRELGATTPWSGRIFVELYAAKSTDAPITLTTERFRDGWQYELELPNVLERSRYLRALIQALLLEMANRSPGTHPAEIPPWLSEGLTQQLLASSELEVLLPPPRPSRGGLSLASTNRVAVRSNPLEQAHRELTATPPLTFQELSWPTQEKMEGASGEVFRTSAQLFVTELLRLDNGRACLRQMIADLPRYYNWQFAFLDAFQAYFPRPVAVEKWWALRVIQFTGRDLTQTWSADESWQKLDELLHSRVQVRLGTNELPLHAEVKLQSMIREWDPASQTQAIQGKLRELDMLRLRLAPNLVALLDQYRMTLANYIEAFRTGRARKAAARRQTVEETLQQLDSLDSLFADMRPEQKIQPVNPGADSPPDRAAFSGQSPNLLSKPLLSGPGP